MDINSTVLCVFHLDGARAALGLSPRCSWGVPEVCLGCAWGVHKVYLTYLKAKWFPSDSEVVPEWFLSSS